MTKSLNQSHRLIGVKMKKLLLFLIFLFTISFVSANCEDIDMNVNAVEKNDSCYTFFSVVFKDIGCQYNCFEDVSNFIIIQGNEVLKNVTDIITTNLGISFQNTQCNSEDVSLIVYDLNGSEYCRQDFILEEEYQEWQDYINPKNDTNETVNVEEQIIPPIDEPDEITIQDDEENIPATSMGGAPGGDSSVPLPPQSVEEKTIEPIINTISVDNKMVVEIEDVVIESDISQEEQKEKELVSSKLVFYITSIIIILAVLGFILYLFLRPSKPVILTGKKRKRRRK